MKTSAIHYPPYAPSFPPPSSTGPKDEADKLPPARPATSDLHPTRELDLTLYRTVLRCGVEIRSD